jgi:hypothetical protein
VCPEGVFPNPLLRDPFDNLPKITYHYTHITNRHKTKAIPVTDSELRKVFSKGFANPQHLDDLLKRTDLPKDRQDSVRTNLSDAYLSRQIQNDALQRFVSQLSKAKSWHAFDQVLAELRHANRLISSGVVAKNSLVFTSAKKGRQYHLGSTTVKIDPVHEADALYLGTDGLIHLHEVKNTANALRQKLNKHPEQLQRMLRWRNSQPDKREIRMVISREEGWTQVFVARQGELAALQILNDNHVGLTIGESHLTTIQLKTLLNETIKKIKTLQKQNAFSSYHEFYQRMSTLAETEPFLGVALL